MNETRLRYFEQEDVLHLVISDEPESRSVELSPNIAVELNDKNEMIGVGIDIDQVSVKLEMRELILRRLPSKVTQLA